MEPSEWILGGLLIALGVAAAEILGIRDRAEGVVHGALHGKPKSEPEKDKKG